MSAYPIVSIVVAFAAMCVVVAGVGAAMARVGFPLPRADARIGRLDGLRGYLAVSVLGSHFLCWMEATRFSGAWKATTIPVLSGVGADAVSLFFMTTGILFYPRVLAGFRATSWKATLTNRFFRIIPLVVVSVAAITLIIALRVGRGLDRNYPVAALMWITATHELPLLGYKDSGRLNAYVLWSLHFEWLFYLFVLPICAAVADGLRRRTPRWALPAALAVVPLFLNPHWLGGLMNFLPLFAVGMLAYELREREKIRRVLETRWSAVAALVGLVVAMSLEFAAFRPCQVALFGFFFVCVACGNDILGTLASPGARVLGECSYAIYLLHGTVLDLLFVEGGPATRAFSVGALPALLPIVAAAVVGLAAVAHILVERPAIRVGHELAGRWRAARPAAEIGAGRLV
jgi:peptidoglycan/LPS O-acetylase OafA/YrhL